MNIVYFSVICFFVSFLFFGETNMWWKFCTRYLDMLPTTFGTPLWFIDDEFIELKGTSVHRATELQVKNVSCCICSDKFCSASLIVIPQDYFWYHLCNSKLDFQLWFPWWNLEVRFTWIICLQLAFSKFCYKHAIYFCLFGAHFLCYWWHFFFLVFLELCFLNLNAKHKWWKTGSCYRRSSCSLYMMIKWRIWWKNF